MGRHIAPLVATLVRRITDKTVRYIDLVQLLVFAAPENRWEKDAMWSPLAHLSLASELYCGGPSFATTITTLPFAGTCNNEIRSDRAYRLAIYIYIYHNSVEVNTVPTP